MHRNDLMQDSDFKDKIFVSSPALTVPQLLGRVIICPVVINEADHGLKTVAQC